MKARRSAALLVAAGLLWSGTVAAQDAAAERLPEPGTPLQPGRYVSDAVGPTIEFRVDEGWLVGPGSDGPIFTLERTDPPGSVVSFTRFDGETFLDSCDASSMATVEPSVGRLAEIIAGNPFLNAGPPAAVEVDGRAGLALDVGVPEYTECRLPFLLIWAVPIGSGGEFVQVANQQSRFILLDVEGEVIVIAIESFPGVPFGGLLQRSLEVVESMRIAPADPAVPDVTPSTGPTPSPEPVARPEPSPEVIPSPSE